MDGKSLRNYVPLYLFVRHHIPHDLTEMGVVAALQNLGVLARWLEDSFKLDN